jgi:hypothetical protein
MAVTHKINKISRTVTNIKYLTAIQKTLLRMIKTFQIQKYAAFVVSEKTI